MSKNNIFLRKLLRYEYNVICGSEIAYIATRYNIPVTKSHLKSKFMQAHRRCDYAWLMADQPYLIDIFAERAEESYNDDFSRNELPYDIGEMNKLFREM